MTQIGDILRVTAKQTLFGENMFNVFFYEVFAGSNGLLVLGAIADEWAAEWKLNIAAALSVEVELVEVKIENMTNGVDFIEFPTSQNGNIAGECSPSFVAYGVQQKRSTKVTRNGSKRFSGVPESQHTDNEVTLGQNEVDKVTAFCSTILTLTDYDGQGNDCNLDNVIVGRTKNAQGVYELDLSKINRVSSASMNTLITSQTSRKA